MVLNILSRVFALLPMPSSTGTEPRSFTTIDQHGVTAIQCANTSRLEHTMWNLGLCVKLVSVHHISTTSLSSTLTSVNLLIQTHKYEYTFIGSNRFGLQVQSSALPVVHLRAACPVDLRCAKSLLRDLQSRPQVAHEVVNCVSVAWACTG